MAHDGQKEIQEASLIGRILSMEFFLLVMGIVLLVYGIINGQDVIIFFGLVVIPGVFLLRKVRQKDWAKHWEEMEAEKKMRAEYEERRKALAEEARKAGKDEK